MQHKGPLQQPKRARDVDIKLVCSIKHNWDINEELCYWTSLYEIQHRFRKCIIVIVAVSSASIGLFL